MPPQSALVCQQLQNFCKSYYTTAHQKMIQIIRFLHFCVTFEPQRVGQWLSADGDSGGGLL